MNDILLNVLKNYNVHSTILKTSRNQWPQPSQGAPEGRLASTFLRQKIFFPRANCNLVALKNESTAQLSRHPFWGMGTLLGIKWSPDRIWIYRTSTKETLTYNEVIEDCILEITLLSLAVSLWMISLVSKDLVFKTYLVICLFSI